MERRGDEAYSPSIGGAFKFAAAHTLRDAWQKTLAAGATVVTALLQTAGNWWAGAEDSTSPMSGVSLSWHAVLGAFLGFLLSAVALFLWNLWIAPLRIAKRIEAERDAAEKERARLDLMCSPALARRHFLAARLWLLDRYNEIGPPGIVGRDERAAKWGQDFAAVMQSLIADPMKARYWGRVFVRGETVKQEALDKASGFINNIDLSNPAYIRDEFRWKEPDA